RCDTCKGCGSCPAHTSIRADREREQCDRLSDRHWFHIPRRKVIVCAASSTVFSTSICSRKLHELHDLSALTSVDASRTCSSDSALHTRNKVAVSLLQSFLFGQVDELIC